MKRSNSKRSLVWVSLLLILVLLFGMTSCRNKETEDSSPSDATSNLPPAQGSGGDSSSGGAGSDSGSAGIEDGDDAYPGWSSEFVY